MISPVTWMLVYLFQHRSTILAKSKFLTSEVLNLQSTMQPSDIPPCFYRISVKALILDETRTKFLIAKEQKGVWELPGGGLEWGASPQADLAREIEEEVGLQTTWVADDPSYFLTFQDDAGSVWRANVLYEATLSGLDFKPSDECVEIKFVTPAEIASLNALVNVQKLANLFKSEKHTAMC